MALCYVREKSLKNKALVLKIAALVLTVVLAVIDQLTKWLAVTYVMPSGSIPIVKFGETEWINFTYCENTGMSFSMLEGQRFILIALPIILLIAAEWYIFSGRAKSVRSVIALAALAGGGLGNLIDRVLNGYVVDFIDFRIINFAIFNFADICAVCGGIAFALFICIEEYREDKQKKAEAETKSAEQEQSDENV